MSSPVLANYDHQLKWIVDSFANVLGVVLFQMNSYHPERPVTFASRVL